MDVDLVGFISAKLRDLRGIRTLANELIQNADDAEGATEIRFDFREDALYVSNDGVFLEKDFTRFRHIASGGKREEDDTTGAFGIGFISVYQITDHPELTSSGRHWIIQPELESYQRVTEYSRPNTVGTAFRLPWALDPESPLRQQLRAEPVDLSLMDEWVNELAAALPGASLFLKRLNTLELCRHGVPVVTVRRLEEEGQTLLEVNGQTQMWHMLDGDFSQQEGALRKEFPQIERKRKSKVRLAVPADGQVAGLLCACLPTQMGSGLPLHINADFFPTTDRKRLQFENDYQAQWNRAALKCAATVLASKLHYLREQVLGHNELWALVSAAFGLDVEARQGRQDRVFREFWEQMKQALTVGAYIYTGKDEWETPSRSRYLLSPEEEEARDLLQAMGVTLVHPDLRPYQNLLAGDPISVKYLDLRDIADALKRAGLTGPTPVGSAPAWLQKDQLWVLWRQVSRLLRRRSGGEQDLATCAFALANGSLLYPPGTLFRATPPTVEVFRPLLQHPFLADLDPEGAELFDRLCPAFTVDHAIDRLQALGAEELHQRLGNTASSLLRWFADRRAELTERSRTALAALEIFPAASGGLCRLTQLSLPGGFEDPLKLTDLVDHNRCDGLEDFLRELGVKQLTFPNYVRDHAIPALQSPGGLSVERQVRLVYLISQRLSEIEADPGIRRSLSQISLVECTDGQSRPAHKVYFQTPEVRDVLGLAVPFSRIPYGDSGTARLYWWMGVMPTPRPADVLARIDELAADAPLDENRRAMELVFRYLAGLNKSSAWDNQTWGPLKGLTWLPARGDTKRWYTPKQVYSVFQDYLFASQGRFLDFPRSLQGSAGSLLDYLEVDSRPSVGQVVDHLLVMAQQGLTVNQEVYTFLNDNGDDSSLNRLQHRPCLLLPTGEYKRPDHAFWGEHPFGSRRIRLSPDLRQFHALFTRLKVREQPDHSDAIAVLQEIEGEYTRAQVVDAETQVIVHNCWRLLTECLIGGGIGEEDLARLRDNRVVVNAQQILRQPSSLFFEDRGGPGHRFRELLTNELILRPHDAWPAMQAAGVLSLRAAARVRLVHSPNAVPDGDLRDLLVHRFDQVLRCLNPIRNLDSDRVRQLRFVRADGLTLQWSVSIRGRWHAAAPEDAPAFYHQEENTIYLCAVAGNIPWAALAREIAVAAGAEEEIGLVASGIKEVLSARSHAEAVNQLSDLGFAELTVLEVQQLGDHVVSALGGEAAPPEEDTEVNSRDLPDPAPPVRPPQGEQDPAPTGEPHPIVQKPSDLPGEARPPSDHPRVPPREGTTTRQKEKAKRSRLISYVTTGDALAQLGLDVEEVEERTALDLQGIERVLDFERQNGREAHSKAHNHPGFDIESQDAVTGEVRFIEVKSISCPWSDGEVALSKTQFRTATERGDTFWLYVVERPLDPDFSIHRIQNPAQRATHFAFDQGWQAVGEKEHEWDSEPDYDPYEDD